jgi:probable rRNA maturation factor
MILIEPAIEKRFGPAGLKKRDITGFLSRAIEAANLSGRVTVLLTNDEQMRHLNRVFRQKDKATDVLSFPALQMNGNKKLAGDLAISVEMAAREAKERKHPLPVELKILVLHGVLHLAGWDHEADSGQMARKEELLRRRLGLEQGLILRAQRTVDRTRVGKPRASSTAHKTQARKSGPAGKPTAGTRARASASLGSMSRAKTRRSTKS